MYVYPWAKFGYELEWAQSLGTVLVRALNFDHEHEHTEKSTGLHTFTVTNGRGPPQNTCGLLGPTSKCQCEAQPRTKSRSTNGKLIVPWERTGVWVAAGYPQCTDSEFLWIKWNTADLSSERHEGPVDLSCTVHSCSLRVQPELHPSCQGPKFWPTCCRCPYLTSLNCTFTWLFLPRALGPFDIPSIPSIRSPRHKPWNSAEQLNSEPKIFLVLSPQHGHDFMDGLRLNFNIA